MNRIELSNLAFLIRAVISNPSMETINLAVDNFDSKSSTTFKTSVALLRELTQRVISNDGSKNDLIKKLNIEAERLSNTSKPLEKSVGQSLKWAMESTQNSSSYYR